MGLFKKAESTQAFVKAGVLGFAGSGKTFTTMQMVFGLKERMGSKAPVCFFDTESGSDFFIDQCKERGFPFYQIKARAFTDALAAYDEALELGADVLIFDSVTHIWRELCETYKKRKNRSRLQFQDWDFLKGSNGWGAFTDRFLNTPIHTFICGRAGYEWEYQVIDGKKELAKVGTKMKTESEFGYEPSLLIEMVREKLSDRVNPDAKGWAHKAYILKDRTDTINGEVFEFTRDQIREDAQCVFRAVEPHFACLNIGGKQLGIDTTRDSGSLFNDNGEPKTEAYHKQRHIVYEEIMGLFDEQWPGATADAKKAKLNAFVKIFATRSKTAAESKSLDELRGCHFALVRLVNEERLEDGRETLPLPDYEEYRQAEEKAETEPEPAAAQ